MRKIIVIALIFLIFIFICIPESLAIRPMNIRGDVSATESVEIEEEVNSLTESIVKLIQSAGIFIAVGVMMIIGIKYITGSVEEKAQYKKSMMPYIIGCIVLFGASTLIDEISRIFLANRGDAIDISNEVLGLIQVLGTIITVGVLMVLGIKYMVGSTEEKAEYKKSMLPYLIGAVLLFSSVQITTRIIETVALDEDIDDGGSSEPTPDKIKYCPVHGNLGAIGGTKCPTCGRPLIMEE